MMIPQVRQLGEIYAFLGLVPEEGLEISRCYSYRGVEKDSLLFKSFVGNFEFTHRIPLMADGPQKMRELFGQKEPYVPGLMKIWEGERAEKEIQERAAVPAWIDDGSTNSAMHRLRHENQHLKERINALEAQLRENGPRTGLAEVPTYRGGRGGRIIRCENDEDGGY